MFLGNVFLELERTEHTGEARGAAGSEADDNTEPFPPERRRFDASRKS